MSSTEPPNGPTPPYGEGSTPPPPPPPPPPPAGGQYGAPPPAPSYGSESQYGAPQYGTPPPPAPGYGGTQPGELLPRFLARLIDGILVGIVAGVITAILTAASDSWLLNNLVSSILSAAIYLGYFAFLESSRGQTLGKQILKLKVVGPDGHSNPTMEQAVRRNIWAGLGILGVVPILGAIVGGLAQLVAVILIAVGINSDTARRQHWFDKFAGGTQVLKIG
ncbi:RDD family protein [Nocardioides flavescens]|uniref:RDD family protein n=1 Tax=Nocardioides flavescens TaxID=2691959 RepID=A0A6L7EU61_9ACTN|nr:RDD family protein [Nocardioides flavescens]MXG90230.1 RDD family protein [Nocardioides flavescens]